MSLNWMEAVVLAVLFFGAFTRSSLGFGDAVIAMPLLAMIIDIRTATPLVALCASLIAFTILIKNWRKTDLRATYPLILSSFAGIPVGLLVVKNIPETYLKTILGALLILYGLFRFIKPSWNVKEDKGPIAYFFGFIAGILGGAYNTNGPPIVIYGSLRQWPQERFRATLQGYFFPTGILIFLGHGASGLWTSDVLKLFIMAIPFVLLGIFLGGKAHGSISRDRFYSWVNAAIIGMGLILFVRTLFFL